MGIQAEYSCTTSFSDVFFIDATTAQTIDADLKNIGDNADDTTLDLSQFFPSCSHGNILITSRNRETIIHAPDFNSHVGSLTPKDARDLLLGIIKQVITDETRVLAEVIVKHNQH